MGRGARNDKLTKEEIRFERYRREYGLSEAAFYEMLGNQKGRCAICDVVLVFSGTTKHKSNVGVVDHCHDTGKIRGLLCTKCNKGLGMFNDGPDLIQKALDYLLDS